MSRAWWLIGDGLIVDHGGLCELPEVGSIVYAEETEKVWTCGECDGCKQTIEAINAVPASYVEERKL